MTLDDEQVSILVDDITREQFFVAPAVRYYDGEPIPCVGVTAYVRGANVHIALPPAKARELAAALIAFSGEAT